MNEFINMLSWWKLVFLSMFTKTDSEPNTNAGSDYETVETDFADKGM